MNKFKVGDKIRCIDNEGTEGQLDLNAIYAITYIDNMLLKLSDRNALWMYNRFELVESTSEAVNNPDHYGGKSNPYEVIKIIEHFKLGFHLGNVLKYILRAGKKDPMKDLEDNKKAQWYLNREIQNLEKKTQGRS